jgi:hypothetical protein
MKDLDRLELAWNSLWEGSPPAETHTDSVAYMYKLGFEHGFCAGIQAQKASQEDGKKCGLN